MMRNGKFERRGNVRLLSFLFCCSIVFSVVPLHSQLFFQFEQANKIKTKRYSAGDKIMFRTGEFGENWLTDEIIQILPEDNALVFYDRITYLDEMTHFQYNRPWAKITGGTLLRFGASWLVFGGAIEGLRRIDALETDYEFGTDTLMIGLGSMATGYLINRLWGKAIKKINDRNRVRIIDVRF